MTTRSTTSSSDNGNPASVKTALTPEPSAQPTATGPTRQSGKRRRTPVENTDYAAFAARVIRAHARRIADGDVDGLNELVDLAHQLDAATQTAINGLRAFGYSWTDIAVRLGTTRQAAQQRWGHRP